MAVTPVVLEVETALAACRGDLALALALIDQYRMSLLEERAALVRAQATAPPIGRRFASGYIACSRAAAISASSRSRRRPSAWKRRFAHKQLRRSWTRPGRGWLGHLTIFWPFPARNGRDGCGLYTGSQTAQYCIHTVLGFHHNAVTLHARSATHAGRWRVLVWGFCP